MCLRHIHLCGLTRYAHVDRLQEHLSRRLLDFKTATASRSSNAHSSVSLQPDPTIITAQFHPVYTCGRREINTVTPEQIEYLRCSGAAEFHTTLRGGQTTFHGPGQLVAYPVLDLRRHRISPRDYVNMLEQTTIEVCEKHGIVGFRTENPGVWTSKDEKIAAVGVHLRRNVSSHGIGLNVSTDLDWFHRTVACGLEGKTATSFEKQGVKVLSVESIGKEWVRCLARMIEDRGVEKLNVESAREERFADGE